MARLSFNLHFPAGGDNQAKQLVAALHNHAQCLQFSAVGPLLDLSNDDANADNYCDNHPLRMLTLQSATFVPVPDNPDARIGLPPERVFAFQTWPVEDHAEANFGLVRYPKPKEQCGYWSPIDLSGWHWHGWWDMQSELSDEAAHHGMQMIRSLLWKAKELGIDVTIWDVGHI